MMNGMRNLNIVIGVPTQEMVHYRFASCLQAMLLHASQGYPGYGEIALRIHWKKTSILCQSRQELVEGALELGASHLLFLDTDQTFPPDTLQRLLAWKSPVVACNVATKRFPSDPTARKIGNGDLGLPLFTHQDSKGLERVWRVGTGIMLLQLSIFGDIPKPWFLNTWKKDHGKHQGEDWYLCEKLDAAEIPMYVDQGLSWQVGHVGGIEFTHDMTLGRYRCDDANGTITEEVHDEKDSLLVLD